MGQTSLPAQPAFAAWEGRGPAFSDVALELPWAAGGPSPCPSLGFFGRRSPFRHLEGHDGVSRVFLSVQLDWRSAPYTRQREPLMQLLDVAPGQIAERGDADPGRLLLVG